MKANTVRKTISRRLFLGATAGVFAMPYVSRGIAADRLVVRGAGGDLTAAQKAAFFDPFQQETGVEIVIANADAQPVAQIKAQVDANSYLWDVSMMSLQNQELLGDEGYLEKLDWSYNADMGELIPEARTEYFMGTHVYASILAYRKDLIQKVPESWTDFWNVADFPGRRAMRKYPVETLDFAELAAGKPIKNLYPLDLDAAFAKLDEIKPDISVWWTSGAQTTQMLQTGEVDMLTTWNARAQAGDSAESPVGIMWNQGTYGVDGFAILKGTPKAELAMKFVAYCANAKRQAEFAKIFAYGPTNPEAYTDIPAERASVLPTYEEHFKLMVLQDYKFWGQKQEKAIERFNSWILE